MVRRPCAGDADWNTLLWNTYGHMPPAPDRIETQLVYWGWTAHPADQADSPVCDIWSAMMYKSCREAVLAMKRHIEHPQTHATWTQKMQNLHVFGFNGAAPQDAIAPVLGPNDRYNLSSQDKIAVLRRYGGHEMVNHRIAQHWKQATARGGLHYRSRDLTHLDEALESCDIRRIRPAFDKWYSNNGSEASHRNRGNVVTQLRDALSGQWGFVSPVY